MRMALSNRIDRMTGYPVEYPQVNIVQYTAITYSNFFNSFNLIFTSQGNYGIRHCQGYSRVNQQLQVARPEI